MFSLSNTLDPLSYSPDIRTAGRLLRALVYAMHNEAAIDHSSLRSLVEERVRELRDEGMPPESMLIEMKRLVSQAIGDRLPGRTTCRLSGAPQRLMSRVVCWSVEQYYSR